MRFPLTADLRFHCVACRLALDALQAGGRGFESHHLHSDVTAAEPLAVLVHGRQDACQLRSQQPQVVQGEWLEVPAVQGDERQAVARRRGGGPQVVAGDRSAERFCCRAELAVLDGYGTTEVDQAEVVGIEREHLGCAPW
jgi:hypothetical protein